MSVVPETFKIITLVVLAVFFAIDNISAARHPEVPSTRSCVAHVGIFVAAALVFGALLWFVAGPTPAVQFCSGWLTEYSLSIDNLFVFVVIMTKFAVPRQDQKYILGVGITLALILRGICILLGAVIIERFTWVFFLFGAFLLVTAGKLVVETARKKPAGGAGRTESVGGPGLDDNAEAAGLSQSASAAPAADSVADSADGAASDTAGDVSAAPASKGIAGWLRSHLPFTDDYAGTKMSVKIDGKRVFTPVLIVFASIGVTDVLFAFDSIPAIFGLTKDPFIVFTANVFALLGLQQLYFLLGDLMDRLAYLPYGLSAVLAFIGVKLLLEALAGNTLPFINGGRPVAGVPEVPTWLSLVVIIVCIGAAAVASVLSARRRHTRYRYHVNTKN